MLAIRRGWIKKSEAEQSRRKLILISCLMSFGGGVILTSCLTHMLPDVNDVLAASIAEGSFPDSGLPVAEIFVLAGFLFIYLLEEVIHQILVATGNLTEDKEGGHGHSHEHMEVPVEENIQVLSWNGNQQILLMLKVAFEKTFLLL